MPAGMLFAVGTLLTWIGIIFGAKAVSKLFFIATRRPDASPESTRSQLAVHSVIAAITVVVGGLLAHPFEKGSVKLPLVWFVMPWSAWLGFGCLAFCIARLIQTLTAISPEERSDRMKSALGCFVSATVFAYLYTLDKDNKISILTGGVPFTLTNFVITIVLAIAAIGAIVVTANSANARGLGKAIVTQLALLAGSVVFGIPFVFLLITSFKEDVDMASPKGIIWVPRVTDTVPYQSPDPAKKHYEVMYNGQVVEGMEIGTEGTKVKIDIFKPMSIRGTTFTVNRSELKEIPVEAKVYTAELEGTPVKAFEKESLADGSHVLVGISPANFKDKVFTVAQDKAKPVRNIGLRTQNYPEALSYLPPETLGGLVYVKNTLILVVMGVVGTLLSSSVVAYAFSRMKFPGKDKLFSILLATMMLPGAITLMPQFLIYRNLGWIDTLYPLWVPAFFGSAFNIFLLRQFFSQIPMELEDAAKIDGCSYPRTFWSIMIPQIKPALAVIAIWTFMGAWNNFMGPLIYVNSPENMPLSYALSLFNGDRKTEPGLLMAFTTLTTIPVIALFAFAQKYFIEGVTLSGLGGR